MLSERPPTGPGRKAVLVPSPGGLSKGSTKAWGQTALGGGGQQQARGTLTASGKEAHLPQKEGGVHVAQGLLHVLEAGVAQPGRENKPKDKLTTEKAEAPLLTPEAKE